MKSGVALKRKAWGRLHPPARLLCFSCALSLVLSPGAALASPREPVDASASLTKAQRYLFRTQNRDGSWVGDYFHPNWRRQALLPWQVLFLDYMGVDSAMKRKAIRLIAAAQRGNGDFGDVGFNFGAILALEHAGSPYAGRVAKAKRFVASEGQRIEKAPLWIQLCWALDGRLDWKKIPLPTMDASSLRDAWKREPAQLVNQKIALALIFAKNLDLKLTTAQGSDLKKAADLLELNQLPDGSWDSILGDAMIPAVALKVTDEKKYEKAISKAVRFAKDYDASGGSFRLPVWDTAYALLGFMETGLEDPRLDRAYGYLGHAKFPTEGWGFTPANAITPDLDDTGECMAVLAGTKADRIGRSTAAFVFRVQHDDGGWNAYAFEDQPIAIKAFVRKKRYLQLEKLNSETDVVAHLLFGLGRLGYRVGDPRIDRAVTFVRGEQERDGSFRAYYGSYVYGTSAAIVGLRSVGAKMSAPDMRKAVKWLKRWQHGDGGWGEDPRAYENAALAGRGRSAPGETGLALIGLLYAGESPRSISVQRGIGYLVRNQHKDGGWHDMSPTARLPVFPLLECREYANSAQNEGPAAWALAAYQKRAWPKTPVPSGSALTLGAAFGAAATLGIALAVRKRRGNAPSPLPAGARHSAETESHSTAMEVKGAFPARRGPSRRL